MNACILAMAALVPLALGPLPQGERSLVLALCGGGEITIPLKDGEPEDEAPCAQLGCHAGTCRDRRAPRSI